MFCAELGNLIEAAGEDCRASPKALHSKRLASDNPERLTCHVDQMWVLTVPAARWPALPGAIIRGSSDPTKTTMKKDLDKNLLETGGAISVLADVAGSDHKDFIGRHLGDYRITGLVAEGGMSRVYRAERTDGSFQRDVAIKVALHGQLNEAARQRFALEPIVLASLNHPNISQLYDAQVSDEGWPYMVMELVTGGPISDFLAGSSTDVDDRVRMLVDIVAAVAYAHARLVVHRDIKPSNVLVNDEGQPKLLDFGIAKMLQGDERDLTKSGPMTPRYASPEQLLGQPITVASDIYQLGLLIYEVLVGKPLNQDQDVTTAIQRAAEQRPLLIEAEVRRQLPREMVLIIEQCLRLLPDERYRDANSLHDDLEAYLEGYPVSAVGQSAGYRFRKFVGRNVPSASIIAIATIAIVGSTLWYTGEITRQRDEAQRQTELADESLDFLASFFTAASPDNAQGRELSALDMLDEGTERITTELTDQPEIQSRLYREIAETYRRLSNLDRAMEVAGLGLDATRTAYPDDRTAPLGLLSIRATVLRQQGQAEEAARIYRDILETASTELGPRHEQALAARHNLSIALWRMGDTSSAIAELRSVLAEKIASTGEANRSALISANALVAYLRAVGQLDEAIETAERYLPMSRSVLGEHHTLSIDFETNMALALQNRDGPAAAIPHFETVVDANRVVRGEDTYEYWHSYTMLVKAHIETGIWDPWVDELRLANEKMSEHRGEADSSVLVNKAVLAAALVESGRAGEATQVLDEVLEVQERTIGLEHPNAFYTQVVKAKAEISADTPGAMEAAEALLSRMNDKLGPDHVLTGMLRDVISAQD